MQASQVNLAFPETNFRIISIYGHRKAPLAVDDLLRAATEKEIVSYTTVQDKEDKTYYGRVAIDIVDRRTGEPVHFSELTDQKEIPYPHYFCGGATHMSSDYTGSQWTLFGKRRKSEIGILCEFLDIHGEAIDKDGEKLNLTLYVSFIGLSSWPENAVQLLSKVIQEYKAILEVKSKTSWERMAEQLDLIEAPSETQTSAKALK